MQKIYLSLLALWIIPFSVSAIELGGITMPDTLDAEQSLILNGAGIRSKFVFELYVAGLYLGEKSSKAKDIIAAEEPMALRLHIISPKITSKKMIKATWKGFENATRGNTTAIETEIEQFLGAFSDKISVGDVFEFVYTPHVGTVISKNGVAELTIDSVAFKQALFGIWLSDRPAQAPLKGALLGQ